MKNSYVFLSDGFEEIEALAVVDILRRAKIPTITISMNSGLEVTSSHGVKLLADRVFVKAELADADYLILPGGSTKLDEYDEFKALLVEHSERGGRVAAICAAPMVLGGVGLLEGKCCTCYPGFEAYLKGATFVESAVVKDGSLITANGPASSLKFAYALVAEIVGEECAAKLKQQMML